MCSNNTIIDCISLYNRDNLCKRQGRPCDKWQIKIREFSIIGRHFWRVSAALTGHSSIVPNQASHTIGRPVWQESAPNDDLKTETLQGLCDELIQEQAYDLGPVHAAVGNPV